VDVGRTGLNVGALLAADVLRPIAGVVIDANRLVSTAATDDAIENSDAAVNEATIVDSTAATEDAMAEASFVPAMARPDVTPARMLDC